MYIFLAISSRLWVILNFCISKFFSGLFEKFPQAFPENGELNGPQPYGKYRFCTQMKIDLLYGHGRSRPPVEGENIHG